MRCGKAKKHWKKGLLILLTIPALLFVGCHHKRCNKFEYVAKKISSKLDLDDAQEIKLQAVVHEVKTIHRESMEEKLKIEAIVVDQIKSAELDRQVIKDLMAKKRQKMDANFDRVFKRVSEFHKSLTPEQKEEAVALLTKFTKKMRECLKE